MDTATENVTVHPRSVSQWVLAAIIGRRPKRTAVRLAILVCAGCWIYFATPPIRVSGISMEPTFHNQKINFVNKLAYTFSRPHRGDVVGIRLKPTDGIWYLKRVVGLPGETIAFQKGRLYINDQPLDEPYVKTPCDWFMTPTQLGPDQYYVTGDNRSMEFGDHWHQAVALRQIEGKILFRGDLW